LVPQVAPLPTPQVPPARQLSPLQQSALLEQAALAVEQQLLPLQVAALQHSALEAHVFCVAVQVPAAHCPPLHTRPEQQSEALVQLPLILHDGGAAQCLLASQVRLLPGQQSLLALHVWPDCLHMLIGITHVPSLLQVSAVPQKPLSRRQSGMQ
jgi:hypothetical protein